MALSPRGVDVRQSGERIVFRASLKDYTGAKITTGVTSLRLVELQDVGTLFTYDFSSDTFKSTSVTTDSLIMSHRAANNGTYATGIWTVVLTNVTGLTKGGVYIAIVSNAAAFPPDQEREFQYGFFEGDGVGGVVKI